MLTLPFLAFAAIKTCRLLNIVTLFQLLYLIFSEPAVRSSFFAQRISKIRNLCEVSDAFYNNGSLRYLPCFRKQRKTKFQT